MDIIILAAIAAFIMFRLNKQLGQVNEEEREKLKKDAARRQAQMIEIQKKILDDAAKTLKVVGDSTSEGAKTQNIDAISEEVKKSFLENIVRCGTDAESFINGAKSAFEMVIKAFSQDEKDVLKSLLSQKIYDSFNAAIEDRKSQNQKLITNVIAVDKAEVMSSSVSSNKVQITLRISSQQINYITDLADNVIKGDKNQIENISDVWTFEKDINSASRSWIITATHA